MNLRSIYLANGVGVFILLILQYTSRTKLLRRRIEDRIYSFTVLGVMEACVLVYIDLGLYGDPGRIRTKYRPQIIIGLALLAVNVLNFFVPISFYINAQNVYERLPFGYFYYLVVLYYCVTAIFLTRRFERENGAKAFFSIDLFFFPILIGAALQSLFYGLSVAWLAAAIGLVGMFMMQQNELAYVDSLTDTYNRQYLNQIISAWTARGSSFSGVMLDVDGFMKELDDRMYRMKALHHRDSRAPDPV